MSDQPNPPTPPTPPTPPAAGSPAQMAIEFPVNLDAIYTNFALITHAPSEVVVDFARVLPNMPKTRVVARVVMTPLNAKLFLRALTDNLRKFESQFGEIVIPTNLADHLFKPPKAE